MSRLASPSGGFENKLSYPEYCRKAFEREGSRDFAVAIAELARNRKLVRRAPCARRGLAATASPSRAHAPPPALCTDLLSPGAAQNSRTLMFVCWMVSQGAGIVTDDVVRCLLSRYRPRWC